MAWGPSTGIAEDGGTLWYLDELEGDGGMVGEGWRWTLHLLVGQGVEIKATHSQGGTIPRKGVGDGVHLPGNMMDSTVIFRDGSKMSLLALGDWVRLLCDGVDKRHVVCIDVKMHCL